MTMLSLSPCLCCSLSLSLSICGVICWLPATSRCTCAAWLATHTLKLSLELATGGGSDQLQFRVQCACHKKFVVLFCVSDKQNHQSNNNNNKRSNQFCLLCRQIKVPPGGRHDPRPGWVLPTNYAHATNWPRTCRGFCLSKSGAGNGLNLEQNGCKNYLIAKGWSTFWCPVMTVCLCFK